jgi:hypothetical protein
MTICRISGVIQGSQGACFFRTIKAHFSDFTFPDGKGGFIPKKREGDRFHDLQ